MSFQSPTPAEPGRQGGLQPHVHLAEGRRDRHAPGVRRPRRAVRPRQGLRQEEALGRRSRRAATGSPAGPCRTPPDSGLPTLVASTQERERARPCAGRTRREADLPGASPRSRCTARRPAGAARRWMPARSVAGVRATPRVPLRTAVVGRTWRGGRGPRRKGDAQPKATPQRGGERGRRPARRRRHARRCRRDADRAARARRLVGAGAVVVAGALGGRVGQRLPVRRLVARGRGGELPAGRCRRRHRPDVPAARCRPRVKAIRVPSGEQTGPSSCSALSVSWSTPPPSASMT